MPRRVSRRLLIGCVGVPIVVVVLGTLGILIWWNVLCYQAYQDLAAEEAKVREEHEPLTTVQLDEYYVAAPGRPDMTAEIMAALAHCNAQELKSLSEHLPIVGSDPPPEAGMPGAGRSSMIKLEEVVPAGEPWDKLDEAESYLEKLSPALATFEEVARRDGTARYPVDLSLGLDADLGHADSLRHAVRVLRLQFHVQLHRRRPREAADCILAQMALARTLDQHPLLTMQVVKGALDTYAIENVARALVQSTVNDDDLVRLQLALRKMDVEASPRRAIAGDRTLTYMGCIDPINSFKGITHEQIAAMAEKRPQRVMDAAKSLELNRRFVEAAEQSLHAALEEGQALDDEMLDWADSRFKVACYFVTSQTAPLYRASAEGFAKFAALRDVADAAIAAERYRRKNGNWAKTLAQLTPEYLPKVPTDPFDGNAIRMFVADGGGVVYSIGKDGKDNQGYPDSDLSFFLNSP